MPRLMNKVEGKHLQSATLSDHWTNFDSSSEDRNVEAWADLNANRKADVWLVHPISMASSEDDDSEEQYVLRGNPNTTVSGGKKRWS